MTLAGAVGHPAASLTAADIEACYRSIGERMADLPLYNPALTIELVGWQPCVGDSGVAFSLGVLITPWCMNLWVGDLGDQTCPPLGSDWVVSIGDFEYRLTMAHHLQLGRYASSALESLMSRFVDMDSARQFAREVLALVLADVKRAETAAPYLLTNNPPAAPAGISRRGLFSPSQWLGNNR
ncbi:[NiFe]-hydrogenase assembly chaperone HybE [Parathalassolituus penaei]|uniref:[NiFe]-hydrogenase assembly chaperone HybE n=1 Tax=Parathalassolituus penaei TaxID=2997323 RepID=A0A9X3EDR7_9GAMM|nr:[NiFe]-hydrogenase assembly chaperone HybE [Parathalassolituus penaei]MCY0964840.1 [NiFe]-hydrogenase assembly chaperone HybE [Parathalassolituus penaei]